jgi:invasin-like protein/Big-like domain-containing protein
MVPFRLILSLVAPLSAAAMVACASGDLVMPPGGPAQIEMLQGDEQIGSVGLPLEKAVRVRVLDQAGHGVPNRAVTWVVSAGGGRASPQTSRTDEEGIASATWILGPAAGPNTLNAVVSEVGLVTFSAMAAGEDEEPAPSASRSSVTAAPSTIEVGTGTTTITVVVRDENGEPIEGAIVVLHATGEGNSVIQPALTDPTGTTTGTLSSSVTGTKVITATVGGSLELHETAEVTAVAASGGVHHFVFRVQPHDVKVGEWFDMEVAMVDQAGSLVPLSGIEIYAGLFLKGYDVGFNVRMLGDRFRDTENGVAVFRLAISRKGRYRFRALSDELPSLGPHGPEPYLFSKWFDVK